MSVDLGTVARVVSGSLVRPNWKNEQGPRAGHGDRRSFAEYTRVDELTRLDQYFVVGSNDFATLVTGSESELRARVAQDRSAGRERGALELAVFVTDADSPSLRRLLAAHRMTAILGAAIGGEALHAALSALIATDRAAADRLVTAGTKVLTQVARRGGATAVIAELAHRIDGWAVLLDANGQLIASAGAGRLHIDDAVAVALGRPVRVRHPGLQAHQVGSDRDLTGYLVIASRASAMSRNRDLASQAAALFDLVLRTRDPSITEGLGREALRNVLLTGGASATDLLRRWGVHETSLTAFALGARTRTIDLERLVSRWLDELGEEHMYASEPGLVQGFIADDLIDGLATRVAAATPLGKGVMHLGLGLPASTASLGGSAIQARQALGAALDDGRTVVRYAELPTVELVLDNLIGDSAAQLVGVLDGLRDPSGEHGELTETLRVYLSLNSGQRASAARLNIHRQTLMARIARIEELTGLSMDRPDDRASAWIALRALGR